MSISWNSLKLISRLMYGLNSYGIIISSVKSISSSFWFFFRDLLSRSSTDTSPGFLNSWSALKISSRCLIFSWSIATSPINFLTSSTWLGYLWILPVSMAFWIFYSRSFLARSWALSTPALALNLFIYFIKIYRSACKIFWAAIVSRDLNASNMSVSHILPSLPMSKRLKKISLIWFKSIDTNFWTQSQYYLRSIGFWKLLKTLFFMIRNILASILTFESYKSSNNGSTICCYSSSRDLLYD